MNKIISATGKSLEDLTMDAVLKDKLGTADFQISATTLLAQAEQAENAGYELLAHNLRRAAELTHIDNEKILEIYNTLRPGRTTYARLITLAEHLENDLAAPLTSALVRDAAEAYVKRGLVTKA
ncbi:MAG: diol dehydratase small subunit [Anaerolineae bacterium]|nr:diol dehydratase small subunit [Anaerolineae bacterium]